MDIMASNQNQAFLRERLSNVKDEVNPYIPDQQQMQTFQRSANGYTGQRSNQVNSRTLGAFGGGFSGMFGGGPSISNLVILGLITGDDIFPTCPVNVPYCQRYLSMKFKVLNNMWFTIFPLGRNAGVD